MAPVTVPVAAALMSDPWYDGGSKRNQACHNSIADDPSLALLSQRRTSKDGNKRSVDLRKLSGKADLLLINIDGFNKLTSCVQRWVRVEIVPTGRSLLG